MNKKTIYNAFSKIDDELIDSSLQEKASEYKCTKRRTFSTKKWLPFISVFLCLAVLFTVVLWTGVLKTGKSRIIVLSDPILKERTVLDNIWDNGSIRVYTLLPSSGSPLADNRLNRSIRLLSVGTSSDDAEASVTPYVPKEEKIDVSQSFCFDSLNGIEIESVFNDRFVLAYDRNMPYIIDLESGNKINLSASILKERYVDGEEIAKRALEIVSERYPGLTATEENRNFISYNAYRYAGLDPEGFYYRKIQELRPFLDYTTVIEEGFAAASPKMEAYRYGGFFVMIEPYINAAINEIVPDKTQKSLLQILAIDGITGKCLYTKTSDFIGNDCGSIWLYDIAANTETKLGYIMSFTKKDVNFRFALDGKRLVITEPVNVNSPLSKEFYESDEMIQIYYRGENIYVANLQSMEGWNAPAAFGAGKGILSSTGTVIAARSFPKNSEAQIDCTYNDYVGRFEHNDPDNGSWLFTVSDSNGKRYEISIEGTFERFAADDTVVIMRKGGQYRAYSLIDLTENEQDGNYLPKDITTEIVEGRYFLYAHEYFKTIFEDGTVKRTNYFTGETVTIDENVDNCIFSEDRAFCFTSSKNDSFAHCFNIATLESCVINPGADFINTLRITEGVSMSMLYNENENILTLCFKKSEETLKETDSGFYEKVFSNVSAIKNN